MSTYEGNCFSCVRQSTVTMGVLGAEERHVEAVPKFGAQRGMRRICSCKGGLFRFSAYLAVACLAASATPESAIREANAQAVDLEPRRLDTPTWRDRARWEALDRRVRSATAEGLDALVADKDTSTSLAAGWEKVRRSIVPPNPTGAEPPAPNERELRRFASLIEKRAGVVAPKPWMDSLLSATACGGRDNTVGFDAGDYSVKRVVTPTGDIRVVAEDTRWLIRGQQLPINRAANSVRASSFECAYVRRKDGRDTGDRGRRC